MSGRPLRNRSAPRTGSLDRRPGRRSRAEHAAWRSFIRYCESIGHGEIGKLKIQDGLPVLAEVTRQKVKFG